jgi:hypothetical protein
MELFFVLLRRNVLDRKTWATRDELRVVSRIRKSGSGRMLI